ncbi:SDR family oxidoreductase [Aurantiacibacter spongiae]|uniref:SDR family oxidoreductase n=1 Tax=Aurantiacibacter spongiae TaxID=2488860 RepID=A0A3N5DSK4_9SPHN|nr:SDR family oxidoreductase [Aurantiacibacter spongiae]RPF72221.1 SDR family oxidoreductase [Aurantiacibacter spongiae]
MTDKSASDISDAHTARPSLKGRKAVVTGGTTGIGRAIAVLLASEGVEIFTCGRDERHLADGLARINAVGTGHGIACDLAEKGGLDRFFEKAKETLGDWDIAVLNAAIPAEGLDDMSEDDVRYALAADFTATVIGAHKAVDHLKDRGDIVVTGSYSTHKLGGGSTVYAGCKAGVHGFVEALRREVAQQGIKVGMVVPAKTGSDFMKPDMDRADQVEAIAGDDLLRAEDIAVAVHFMLTQPRRANVQEMVVVQRHTSA